MTTEDDKRKTFDVFAAVGTPIGEAYQRVQRAAKLVSIACAEVTIAEEEIARATQQPLYDWIGGGFIRPRPGSAEACEAAEREKKRRIEMDARLTKAEHTHEDALAFQMAAQSECDAVREAFRDLCRALTIKQEVDDG